MSDTTETEWREWERAVLDAVYDLNLAQEVAETRRSSVPGGD